MPPSDTNRYCNEETCRVNTYRANADDAQSCPGCGTIGIIIGPRGR